MRRAAFTMIELIFVIVILGILSAVALPKLKNVQDDAYLTHANEIFCVTLKSQLLLDAIKVDTIKNFDLNNSITLPSDFSYIVADGVLSTNDNMLNTINQTTDLHAAVVNSTHNAYVYFIDGNASQPPVCAIGTTATSSIDANAIRTKVLDGRGNYL